MKSRNSRCREVVSKCTSFRVRSLVAVLALCFLVLPLQARAGSNVSMIPPDLLDPTSPVYFSALSDDANYAAYTWQNRLYWYNTTTQLHDAISPSGLFVTPFLWGADGRNEGRGVSMSKDGRYTAYTGWANGHYNVYRWDKSALPALATIVVCENCQNPSISSDGRYVAFETNSTAFPNNPGPYYQIYRWDYTKRTASLTEKYKLISRALTGGLAGNGSSFDPSISADGRFIAYTSLATNLIIADNNNKSDVFVYDYNNVKTKRVSGTDPDGVELPDDPSGTIPYRAFDAYSPGISGNGQFVVFETQAPLRHEDTNAKPGDPQQYISDIYIYDRWADNFTRVSMRGQGEEGQSKQGNGSHSPSISSDGGWIVFHSDDQCLADQDPIEDCDNPPTVSNQVFMRDRVGGRTFLLSRNGDSVPGNSTSFLASVSKGGLMVGFTSQATDLDPPDPNGSWDNAFLFDRKYAEIELNSLTKENRDPVTSGDGMVFTIVVKNTGPLSATGVRYANLTIKAETSTPADPLKDTAFDIMWGSSVFKNFQSCTKVFNGGTPSRLIRLSCPNIPLDATVAPGQSVSRQIAVRPYDSLDGKITLDVSIDNTKEKDNTPDNNWAQVVTGVCAKGNAACLATPLDNHYPQ
ncbi:MAG: DUF11 domain-containing protein [Desulfobacteraceae bacterium]|nr:DUF11 domain-containing protein [Desulfobacteraceae bacterium]